MMILIIKASLSLTKVNIAPAVIEVKLTCKVTLGWSIHHTWKLL